MLNNAKKKLVLFNRINTVNKFLTILNTSRLLTCFYLKFPSQSERFSRGNSRLIKTTGKSFSPVVSVAPRIVIETPLESNCDVWIQHCMKRRRKNFLIFFYYFNILFCLYFWTHYNLQNFYKLILMIRLWNFFLL